jgi:hypothetical protein
MKKLLKAKPFIILSIVIIVLLFVFLFLYAALGNDLFGGIAEVLSNLADTQIHWWILGTIAGLVAFALLILFVFPFILYVITKITTYLSLFFVCLKEKHSCKFTRTPFASLGGIKEKADIEIKTSDYKIFVHFIDVPLGFRKVLTFINERSYLVSSSTPGKVKRIGGGPPGGKFSGGQTTAFFGSEREASDEDNKYKSIPDFESNDYHYIVITPGYVDAKVIVENGTNDVAAETAVGNITVCKYKTFKKRLKNQLYTPMNNGK